MTEIFSVPLREHGAERTPNEIQRRKCGVCVYVCECGGGGGNGMCFCNNDNNNNNNNAGDFNSA